MERDIKNAVDYDGGHPAEAMLLMGLAMLFIGMFVVLENFNRNRVSLTSCYFDNRFRSDKIQAKSTFDHKETQ